MSRRPPPRAGAGAGTTPAGPLPAWAAPAGEAPPGLVARLEGIDVVIVVPHPAFAVAFARHLVRPRRHEFGVFSGVLGEAGGPCAVAVLVSGGPGPERAWAAVRQAAVLCPRAVGVLHAGLAGGLRPDVVARGEVALAGSVEVVAMPPALLDPATPPSPPEARCLGGAGATPPPAPDPDVAPLAAAQELRRRAFLTLPATVDTPVQREWLERRHGPALAGGALMEREAAAAALGAAAEGRAALLAAVVTDHLATLTPGGLASWERAARAPLRAALEGAAARLVGVARAWSDLRSPRSGGGAEA